MLDRLRIRGKFALVMAVPLVAVALLTVPSVLGAVERAQRAEEIGSSMRLANGVTSLVSEVRQERLLSLGYLLGAVDRSRLVTQSTRVTDRMADLRYDARDGILGDRGLTGPVTDALVPATQLAELREPVLERTESPERVVADFGAAIAGLIDALRLTDGVDLATPAAQQVAGLDAALRVNEAASQSTDLRLLVAATDPTDAAALSQVAAQYAGAQRALDDYLARFTRYATAEQTGLLGLMTEAYGAREVLGTGAAPEPGQGQAQAQESEQQPPAGGPPVAQAPVAEVFAAVESLSQLGRFVETKIITDVLIEVAAQERAELRTAYLVGGGALLVVVAVVVLTLLLARTVVRPLLGLTASADRVARVADAELARISDEEEGAYELPEPVRLDPVHVTARDEIGDLARAFDRVQATSVRLVERQVASRRNVALMFGYLGRRTQNLVGRQVDLIDQLERNETDTERLSDLYRLDHISSRLRRNAGSLVVLSGAAGVDEHVAPLPLTDVTRLALGEIEDFARVDVQVPVDLAVAPAAVGDLVLVLAELMENATSFSPPHTRVQVSATSTPYGVEVSIVDHGIGMSQERLADENARIARRERLDLAPTEVLGLFVVGRLARRHGLRVTLSATPEGGVTAVVGLGQDLLVAAEPPARVVATAAPPVNGAPSQAEPARHLVRVGVPGLEPSLVDMDALSRASRTLESGRPWNAFALPAAPTAPAGPAAPGEPGGPDKPERPGGPDKPDGPDKPEGSDEPQAPDQPEGPDRPRGRAAPAAVPPDPPRPRTADQSRVENATRLPRTGGLRRRVPGATLDAGTGAPATRAQPPASGLSSGPAPGPRPAQNPDEARDLVEQIQTGVSRALSEISSDDRTEEEHDDR